MVDFSSLRLIDGPPIYLQIISHVKHGIVAGGIAHGHEMPSRRVLSVQLGVNPNTIQKAYRMLEEEGLILSQPGAKSYIQLSPTAIQSLREGLLNQEISAMIGTLKSTGITKQEALALLAQRWED